MMTIPPSNSQVNGLQEGEIVVIEHLPLPGGKQLLKFLEDAAAFITGANKKAVPIIEMFSKRSLELVSKDEAAMDYLQKAYELLQNPQTQKVGVAYAVKAFACVLPDNILDENFWHRAVALTGKSPEFFAELRNAKSQDISEITKTLEYGGTGKLLGEWITYDSVGRFLKGDIDSFLRLHHVTTAVDSLLKQWGVIDAFKKLFPSPEATPVR